MDSQSDFWKQNPVTFNLQFNFKDLNQRLLTLNRLLILGLTSIVTWFLKDGLHLAQIRDHCTAQAVPEDRRRFVVRRANIYHP